MIGFNIGKWNCWDCFRAAMMILFKRSCFMTFLSEWSHKRGVICCTPISVAFSKNHSNRLIFFVGAIAMCNGWGSGGWSLLLRILPLTLFPSIWDNSIWTSKPLPSVAAIRSPIFFRKTLIKCLLSSLPNAMNVFSFFISVVFLMSLVLSLAFSIFFFCWSDISNIIDFDFSNSSFVIKPRS